MFTDVSFTLHLSGLGGDVIIFGPLGRMLRSEPISRCFKRANLTKAGSFSLSSSPFVFDLFLSREGEVGFGGEREPSVGALRQHSVKSVSVTNKFREMIHP